jgi:type VI secretion system secreted protein VgrG
MDLSKDLWMTVTCAKAPGPFVVRSVSGAEELGTLYEYHAELFYELHELDMKSLLGAPMTVHLDLGNGKSRYLSGVVAKIRRGEREYEGTAYHVTLRPEQHKLSYRHNCRIFQDTTVVDVVKAIFKEHGLRAPRPSLFEIDKYRKWDYLTQYRESDFEFIRRILALEGMYFYFDHLADGHQMVLADSISSHNELSGFESVPLSQATGPLDSSEYLTWWSETYELASREVSLRDFDFRHRGPAAVLAESKGSGSEEGDAKAQRYEYPGVFALHENETSTGKEAEILDAEKSEGERLASVRLEEKQSKVECFEAEGNARYLQVGSLFAVSQAPVLLGRKFMIVSTDVTFRNPTDQGRSTDERSYVRLSAMDSKTQFRMPRMDKPVVFGAQTARVVGAKDDEIMTDKYGRIKVKFHWDRREDSQDTPESNSSCWVRVAHPWAGTNWGAMHIPRVGHEVVVQFMDGDPDRPLVTGSVYNATNMPPYKLPDHKTQSGIKSRSTKGGTENNFNEIRFEDLKGKEELHMQAERDMSTHVKRNQSTSVDGDRSVSVGGNHSVSVTGTQSTTVTKKETQTYKADREMKVTGKNLDEITAAHTGKYHAGRTETVEKGDALEVLGSNKTVTVHGEYNSIADTQYKVTNGTNIIFMKGSDIVVNNSGCEVQLSGSDATVTAKASVTIKCGASSISMKSDGTIEITGSKVKIGNANNNAAFEPAGTTINGVKITSASVGMHEISGALIKVG